MLISKSWDHDTDLCTKFDDWAGIEPKSSHFSRTNKQDHHSNDGCDTVMR